MQARHFPRILRRDVRITKKHQVIDVVACIEKQTTHSRVSHLISHKGNRPEMQADKLLYVFHLLVQRHLQALEYLRYPPRSHHFMSMEGPPQSRVISLGGRLCYIMQESRPAKPHIRLGTDLGHLLTVFEDIVFQTSLCNGLHFCCCDIVQDLERVGEILLMSLSLNGFHTFKLDQLRQYALQKSSLFQQTETYRRSGSHKHLVEFLHNALLGEDGHAVKISSYRVQRLLHYMELLVSVREFCCKSYGTDHSERVVAVGSVRIERCAYDAGRQVAYASERIHQRTEILLLKAEGHGVDGKVPSELIFLKGAVFNDRLARITVVGLLAGAYEFDLDAFVPEHGSAEILEYGHIASDLGPHRFGKCDAATFNHNVYILARPAEKTVADISSDDKCTDPQLLCGLGNYAEDLMIQISLSNG